MNCVSEKMPEAAVCIKCGYLLRGLPEHVCPECGQAFNPNDNTTYHNPIHTKYFIRYSLPPRKWRLRLIIIVTLIILFDISTPGNIFFLSGIYFVCAFVLILWITIDYIVHVIYTLLNQNKSFQNNAQLKSKLQRWRWFITPTCLLLIGSALYYPWPAWIRFRLSLPAFEHLVQNGTTSNQSQMVGLYMVHSINNYPNGMVFFQTDNDFIIQAGFMFNPSHQLTRQGNLIQNHYLTDSWYTALGNLRK